MRISKNKDLKLVQFWMTPAEREKEGILDNVKTQFELLKEDKKYKYVIYISGDRNLTDLTFDLLKRNKAI